MTAEEKPQKLPVLCIVGPTATGKSDLGIEVALSAGGEVLSADSMQVYRQMNIGTAKISKDEMQGVPHHLIDLVDPDVAFSVADWTEQADEAILRLHAQGKLPIVVGGTGLYIRAITEDLDFAEQPELRAIRDKWQAFLAEHGPKSLHDELAKRDEQRALMLHPNDTRRVIRALEVVEGTGRLMSSDYDWGQQGGRYHTVLIGLTMPREDLYERINLRVDRMVEQGLYDEVRTLLELGYGEDLASMQAIGYKEMVRAVRGEISLPDAVLEIQQATRRFAKRQLSWFRRDQRIDWLTVDKTRGVAQADKVRIFDLARGLRQELIQQTENRGNV
ncbi:tRNA (adenosine(37)-N6)-dimethylallyltransferase MiaA [Alicyclobacillus ferrooxydans]|uniref:tRNA (adenosine(37)-N6)-dimethylallyltransferase MiaA n=1 Tax=Alicyclobacillus ferrooxydans TaxID=471514 RepID=UPI0009FA0875|nr:tRNA (adenosine(37)-N6)-dimethylallyltransferase MiaA [Alicyclobacillus ferrooxydans]